MTTIGFGDIHPYTSPEMCFSIFFMVLSSGIFGYTMNSIMVIYDKSDNSSRMVIQKNQRIVRYVK